MCKLIIGSDNGLSLRRRPVTIRTNARTLLIRNLETEFSEIWSMIYTFSCKKMHLKMSSGKWRQFCLGLDVLSLFYVCSLWCYLSFSSTSFHITNLQKPSQTSMSIYRESRRTIWMTSQLALDTVCNKISHKGVLKMFIYHLSVYKHVHVWHWLLLPGFFFREYMVTYIILNSRMRCQLVEVFFRWMFFIDIVSSNMSIA